MALGDVIAAVVDVLAGLGLADDVLSEPPPKLGSDRTFLVTADPGESTLAAHRGRNGLVVYQSDDDVLVMWAVKAARDATVETYPEALDVLLATRDALFYAVKDNGLHATLSGFGGMRTDLFGAIDFWNPDVVFGFQLALTCRHQTEAAIPS